MTVSIQVSGIAQTIKTVERDFQRHLERVADALVTEAPKFTPVRTGRASRGWRKSVSEGDFEVYNTVPYTQYLEKPYVKSRQAPRGIVDPTIQSVKRKIR